MILFYPILVKPYLVKYIQFYNPVDEYFKLTDRSKIASVLISYLERKRKYIYIKPENIDPSLVPFKIAVPWLYQNKFGCYISYDNQMRFNDYLRKDFQEKMCEYVLNRKKPNQPNIYKSLLSFREKFDITEDELKFKTMQKWWEREGEKNSA